MSKPVALSRLTVSLTTAALFTLAALPAAAKTITVPVDVSAGPAAFMFTGPIAEDQLFHYGAVIDIYAVIDKQTIEENKGRVPKRYRQAVKSLGEVRYGPSIFIPDAFFISPKLENTGVFGVNWRPFSVGVSLLKRPRFHISAGLLFTYAYIYSDTVASPTHFLRPGLDLEADFEIPFGRSFLISFGWSSHLYVPQKVGGTPFELGFDAQNAQGEEPANILEDLNDTIWHVGMAYVQIHFRFPWEQKI